MLLIITQQHCLIGSVLLQSYTRACMESLLHMKCCVVSAALILSNIVIFQNMNIVMIYCVYLNSLYSVCICGFGGVYSKVSSIVLTSEQLSRLNITHS